MAITYSNLIVRNERRIRLVFSEPLAAGAFGPGASVFALYTVVCTNGSGANPGISAAIVVPGGASNVELALNTDLVAGGIYAVTTVSVPGIDATISPSAVDTFTFGALPAATINVEQPQDDLGALIYGVDLVWTGSDFLETPAGDLATVSGVPNVQGAQKRRLTDQDGIPWDRTWGAQAAQYVEGPAPSGLDLLSVLRRQAVADDRVASATVQWLPDPSSPGDNYFPIQITLRGASPGDGFGINVNLPGTSS
jgi:hypothetical protein